MSLLRSLLVKLDLDCAKFTSEMIKSRKVLEDMKSSLGVIKLDALTNLISKSVEVGKALYNMAQEGASIIAIKESFELVTKSVGVSGDAFMAKMKEVTKYTIDDQAIMIQSNRLFAEGMSQKQVIELAEQAVVAARFMATDVVTAFNSITEAVITGNTRGLRPFGITQKDIAKALEDTATAAGTTEKYLNSYGRMVAIIGVINKEAADKAKLLGISLSPTLSVKFQQVNTIMKEVKDTIAVALIPVLAASTSAVMYLASGYAYLIAMYSRFEALILKYSISKEKRKEADEWLKTSETYSDIGAKLQDIASGLINVAKNTMGPVQEQVKEILTGINKSLDKLAGRTKAVERTRPGKPGGVVDTAKIAKEAENLIIQIEKDTIQSKIKLEESYNELLKNNAIISAMETQKDVELVKLEYIKSGIWSRYNAEVAALDAAKAAELAKARDQGGHLLEASIKKSIDDKYDSEKLASQYKLDADLQKHAIDVMEFNKKMILIGEENLVKSAEGVMKRIQELKATKFELYNVPSSLLAIEENKATVLTLQANLRLLSVKKALVTTDAERKVIDNEIEETEFNILNLSSKFGKGSLLDLLAKKDLFNIGVDLRRQIGELLGDYKLIADTDLKSLESERKRLQIWKDINPEVYNLYMKLNELQKLRIEGTGLQGFTSGFQQYTRELGSTFNQWEKMSRNIASSMESAFSNFFVSIFDKTKSWADKIKGLFQGLADSFIKALSDMLAAKVVSGLFGSSTTGSTSLWGSIIKWIGVAAEGGVTGPMLAHYPIHAYAGGGIASSPQLGIFGEGGGSGEAFVPLKSGKIPVEMGEERGGDTYNYNTFIEATDVNSFAKLYGPAIESIYYKGRRYNKVSMRQ